MKSRESGGESPQTAGVGWSPLRRERETSLFFCSRKHETEVPAVVEV